MGSFPYSNNHSSMPCHKLTTGLSQVYYPKMKFLDETLTCWSNGCLICQLAELRLGQIQGGRIQGVYLLLFEEFIFKWFFFLCVIHKSEGCSLMFLKLVGGKFMDHVALRPRRGEGRLHNCNYWQYLGGSLGGGGKLSCLGGKFPLCPPP